MGTESLAAKLRRVEALRSLADTDARVTGLRRALLDRSSTVVAKAAGIAAGAYDTAVIPDLLAAYDRLFIDPESTDKLALGKHAIATALKELGVADPAPFVRGLQYSEVIWGSDAAAGLRATCAHALVACDLDGVARYELLIDHLVDDDRTVRREVVRAIGQIGGPQSVLVLRLKALAGDADAEVLGAAFAALLELEPRAAPAFVARFPTPAKGAVVLEAAAELAQSRAVEALRMVRRFWDGPISRELRRTIVFACAASPLAEAAAFLLSIVTEGNASVARWALSALGSSRFSNAYRDRARDAAGATADPAIAAAYRTAFESGNGAAAIGDPQ